MIMRVLSHHIAPGLLLLLAAWPTESFKAATPASGRLGHIGRHRIGRHHSLRPLRASSLPDEGEPDGDEYSTADLIYGAGGTLLAPVVLYSEFTLKTTGCGLPAGPFGSLGLAEGVGYLSVIAFCFWSFGTKQRTGSGLRAGPFGLLGAAEGLSWLAGIGGLAVLGFQLYDFGFVPEAIPVEGGRCSSI